MGMLLSVLWKNKFLIIFGLIDCRDGSISNSLLN